METNYINPLLCDFETGFCEIPSVNENHNISEFAQTTQKHVKVIYFTDPICSSCWGIEPQLRKLKLEYGNVIEIEYRMGGLLPDWSYNSGGISKPSDVAHHWNEAGKYYDMPIDGNVWLKDPLHSSYPPSIAFKAVQLQNNEKAVLFLREIREMVFMQNINISKFEYLEEAAFNVGLNISQFKKDYEEKAKNLFYDDLKLSKELGVRGFPTLFFKDSIGNTEFIYGSKPYLFFENAVIKLIPNAVKNEYDKSWENLFAVYNTMTAKEFSELTETSKIESEKLLNKLTENGQLQKHSIKNGAIWKLIKNGTQ